MKTTEEMLQMLEDRKETLTSQLAMSEGMLVSHNYILTCGAYTVCTKTLEDGNKVADLTTKTCPSQWTEEGVKEVISKHSFTKIDGERAEVKAVPFKQWYKEQIEDLSDTIELLKTK